MATLITPKFNYTALTRESIDGKRLYACPDGSKVASVTTILSKTMPKEKIESLQRWRDSIGHQKAQEITVESASRGTRMHSFLEHYLEDGGLPSSGSNPYSIESHIMAQTVIKYGLSRFDEIWGSEIGLYHPGLYAGTTDGIGVHQGDPCIFDFKQSNKPKKEEYVTDYKLQIMAYILAHNELFGTYIKKGVIMVCVKPTTTTPPVYQEFVLEPVEFDYWEGQWWDRVEKYYING